jgi:hypothetical protein
VCGCVACGCVWRVCVFVWCVVCVCVCVCGVVCVYVCVVCVWGEGARACGRNRTSLHVVCLSVIEELH